MSWIKNKILTQKDNLPKLEFAEISPKNKDKLLSKYKASFEKDQKLYDKLNHHEAKQVVHAQPRLSKAVRPTPLPYGPLRNPEPKRLSFGLISTISSHCPRPIA